MADTRFEHKWEEGQCVYCWCVMHDSGHFIRTDECSVRLRMRLDDMSVAVLRAIRSDDSTEADDILQGALKIVL
jgi:hypothetical protein